MLGGEFRQGIGKDRQCSITSSEPRYSHPGIPLDRIFFHNLLHIISSLVDSKHYMDQECNRCRLDYIKKNSYFRRQYRILLRTSHHHNRLGQFRRDKENLRLGSIFGYLGCNRSCRSNSRYHHIR